MNLDNTNPGCRAHDVLVRCWLQKDPIERLRARDFRRITNTARKHVIYEDQKVDPIEDTVEIASIL